MKVKGMAFVMLALFPLHAFGVDNLCQKFVPAKNKSFVDTFNINFLTATRSGTTITGKFTHDFGKNNKPTANIVAGRCTGNQLSFSWRNGSFSGDFSGTLVCKNGIFNLDNILVVINGVSTYITTMYSPPSGPCPT